MAVNVHVSAFLMGALLLLTVPFPWLLGAFGAGCFHELCHYAAIRALGGQVYTLQIRFSGASLEMQPLSPARELLCALAGPAGSLFLVLFLQPFPRLALCALIQAAFNLLPIYPLDGGRAILCAFRLFHEKLLAMRRISGYNSVTTDKEVTL